MDLSTIVPTSDEIVVTLKHPATGKVLENDDKTQMTITLHAPHTKGYKSAMYEQANKRIKDQKKDFTAEELELSTLEVLIAATKSWNITYGGDKPKLTKSKAKEVYSNESAFWIVEQLQEEINSFEAFTSA